LFWATGVYYTNELLTKYDVILLVPEQYRQDSKFQSVCVQMKISEIVYYRHCGNNLIRHIAFSALCKSLLLTHKPVCVVQHDYIGTENMYVFHWAKKSLKNCCNLVMLSSLPSNVS